MRSPGSLRSPDAQPAVGLGESIHTLRQRHLAFAIALVLIGVGVLTVRFGAAQGPEIKPFLPIVATVWALADLMTAFLLLSQYCFSGSTSLPAFAAGYALNGVLTVPYLIAFPRLFGPGAGPLADNPQVSACAWILWHATFPLIVVVSVLSDPSLRRRTISPSRIRTTVWAVVLGTPCVAVLATVVMFLERSALPVLIVHGLYTANFRIGLGGVALLNLFGCCVLVWRRSAMTVLQLWLFVAMLTAMLEAILVAATLGPYSYGWYIGKLETVATASFVLVILLGEVTALYGRLADMAMIDTLTRLPNRRALEDHLRIVFSHAKRHGSGLGLLVVDVDLFKSYNDTYGHAQGDDCLRLIAVALRSSAGRPLDMTARYGGEEFVVLLPETQRAGTIAVAQRIIASLATTPIAHTASALGHVTVSIGVAHVESVGTVEPSAVFAAADEALYAAKASGRNTFIVAGDESPKLRIVA